MPSRSIPLHGVCATIRSIQFPMQTNRIGATCNTPDSKVHGANMGPTGPMWAPCLPHELFIWDVTAYVGTMYISTNKSFVFVITLRAFETGAIHYFEKGKNQERLTKHIYGVNICCVDYCALCHKSCLRTSGLRKLQYAKQALNHNRTKNKDSHITNEIHEIYNPTEVKNELTIDRCALSNGKLFRPIVVKLSAVVLSGSNVSVSIRKGLNANT